MKIPLILFAFVFLSVSSFQNRVLAQTTSQTALWYGYFFTIPLNQSWYTVTEIQERLTVNPLQQNQFLVRTRLHRTIGRVWDLSAGMSLFLHHRSANQELGEFEWPEIRPHLEATLKTKLGKIPLDHRVRGEARFYKNLNTETGLPDEGMFFRGFRARYRIQATFPLAELPKGRSLHFKLADEVMAMAGGEIGAVAWDQNRITGDFSLGFSPNLQLELGYVYWHQKRESGGFLDQHIIRTVVRQRLDFSKK